MPLSKDSELAVSAAAMLSAAGLALVFFLGKPAVARSESLYRQECHVAL